MYNIAQVALEATTLNFEKPYSYYLEPDLVEQTKVGSLVLVPFGRGNKPRLGVVQSISAGEDISRLKPIIMPSPLVLSAELLQLALFLQETTFCPFFDAVKAIVPCGELYKAVEKDGSIKLKKNIQKPKPAKKASFNIENSEIVLNDEQQAAFLSIKEQIQSAKHETALLYGVTSSGKTMVFFKAITEVLALQKTAILLVPEITLASQMIRRLQSVFGEKVAIIHSALSPGARLAMWQSIRSGECTIVVGTRSGIFAPLQNIGIIIIDEEQEHTYHSEQSPRYLAHDVAKFRAAKNNALLLFASATPSINTYHNAITGKYRLYELNKRYNNAPLPEVELLDIRGQLSSGNAGAISYKLAEELNENLKNKKQSIILLNRRGYHTVAVCSSCKETVKCEHCSVAMVAHKSDGRLLCHYCNSAISPIPTHCKACGEQLKYLGFGTQKIEQEMEELFKNARVLRMDTDSTRAKGGHKKMLDKFAKGEYDILIGTQMVAKGLDFPNVTLVGVVGIDNMLFNENYRAFEKVFSLVTQVVGRSGRGDTNGRALIQTIDPENRILQLAARQDYRQFYADEIGFRELNLYPPFCSICVFKFVGKNEKNVFRASIEFRDIIKKLANEAKNIPLRVLGPTCYIISMLNNNYRYKLTIKCNNNKAFRVLVGAAIAQYGQCQGAAHATITLDFNSSED